MAAPRAQDPGTGKPWNGCRVARAQARVFGSLDPGAEIPHEVEGGDRPARAEGARLSLGPLVWPGGAPHCGDERLLNVDPRQALAFVSLIIVFE
jgi:hypothetical protein